MNTLKRLIKNHETLVDEISRLTYKEIEKKARSIMKAHPRCISFCMAMGYATFYDKNGPMDESYTFDYPEYLRKFDEWMETYSEFNVTGLPMKIKGFDGILIEEW